MVAEIEMLFMYVPLAEDGFMRSIVSKNAFAFSRSVPSSKFIFPLEFTRLLGSLGKPAVTGAGE